MAQKVLGWHGHDQLRSRLHHALAGQARVDARILGAVDKVFFLIADFRQVVAARVDVDEAALAAHPAWQYLYARLTASIQAQL